jgi:uncharacterized protein YeaO (DUF488 family)
MNMLKIHTSHYSYSGENRLDITVKTGNKAFAPTWDMVHRFKNGALSEDNYTKEYYVLMRDSYRNSRQEWDKVLAMDEVVLVCFCGRNSFCHRYLLADILTKLGGRYEGEIAKKNNGEQLKINMLV